MSIVFAIILYYEMIFIIYIVYSDQIQILRTLVA